MKTYGAIKGGIYAAPSDPAPALSVPINQTVGEGGAEDATRIELRLDGEKVVELAVAGLTIIGLGMGGVDFGRMYYDSIAVAGEPTTDEIAAAVTRAAGCDSVIAIGGGSVLDAGKAIAAMLKETGSQNFLPFPGRELTGPTGHRT